jgi:hypothetical protein
MARTRRSDYLKSNRIQALPIADPAGAREAARRLLQVHDAVGRRLIGAGLLEILARETGIPAPELVVPDEHQPHRRSGGRIVFSLQGEYRRRNPSPENPLVARGGRPLGRIRVLNRTPARGDVVRPTAFLNTLLHEFCHHHDAEALGLLRSFHTGGFYARLRHLREQVGARTPGPAPRTPARGPEPDVPPFLRHLWSIIRGL